MKQVWSCTNFGHFCLLIVSWLAWLLPVYTLIVRVIFSKLKLNHVTVLLKTLLNKYHKTKFELFTMLSRLLMILGLIHYTSFLWYSFLNHFISHIVMNCLLLKYRTLFFQGPFYGPSPLRGKFFIPPIFHISFYLSFFLIQFLSLLHQRHSLATPSKYISSHPKTYPVTQSRQRFSPFRQSQRLKVRSHPK